MFDNDLLFKSDLLEYSKRADRINLNTIQKFIKIWNDNTTHNSMFQWEDLKVLAGAELNSTVGIVACGPSLDKNIKHLKDFQYPIIAVNRAYNKLKENGINPKYVIAVDGISEPIGSGKEKLIFDLKCNYKLVQEWEGDRYCHIGNLPMYKNDYFHKKIKNCNGRLDTIVMGGNVSLRALAISALILKAKRIVLISHDYSTTKESEVRGTKFREAEIDGVKIYSRDDYHRYALSTKVLTDSFPFIDFVVTETRSYLNVLDDNRRYEIMPLKYFNKEEKRKVRNGKVK